MVETPLLPSLKSPSCTTYAQQCVPRLPIAVGGDVACRTLQLLLELPWPHSSILADYNNPSTAHQGSQHPGQANLHPTSARATAAVACCLSILQQLVSTYPAAAHLCATALTRSEELQGLMCDGLGCPLEAIVTPLLQ